MDQQTVKYVVMGAGAIAQRRHLPEIHAHDRSELVALSDPREERGRKIAEHYGCEWFPDHQAMLKETKSDAAVVATPNYLHCPQTIDALEAGRHVLVEKPMAMNRDEARRMVEAAKRAGKHLMIGMNQRLMPAHVAAKEILDSGRLGKVLAFETNFKHPGPDAWSVDGNKSWFFNKEKAGMGVCGDLGIHKADLMMYLLGEHFARVGGFVRRLDKLLPDGSPLQLDDNAFLELESESGVVGSIHISWTNYGGIEDNGTMLFCEHGVMRVGMDKTYGVMLDFRAGRRERIEVGEMATNEKQVDSGVARQLTSSILDGKPPVIDGLEGYKALNVVLTAIEASDERTIKEIDNTPPF